MKRKTQPLCAEKNRITVESKQGPKKAEQKRKEMVWGVQGRPKSEEKEKNSK